MTIMTEHPWRDADKLRNMYWSRGLSQSEIAELWGCAVETISRWFQKHGIETRSQLERMGDEKYHDGDWLHRKYVDDGLSIYDIADECGVNSSTIRRWLIRNGIDRRDKSETRILGNENLYYDSDWLEDEYVNKGKSLPEIAEDCDASESTIARWLVNHDIGTRSISESVINYNIKRGDIPYKVNSGYCYWAHCHRGNQNLVPIHRLLAVAEYGYDAVVNKDVHHKNGIRWDNRHENIDVLSREKHGKLHSDEYWSSAD